MRRRSLLVLLVAAVLCAGAGAWLLIGPAAGGPATGWTAYSPLSSSSYTPVDPGWTAWRPRVGAALLALGAGAVGAAAAALVLRRPH